MIYGSGSDNLLAIFQMVNCGQKVAKTGCLNLEKKYFNEVKTFSNPYNP